MNKTYSVKPSEVKRSWHLIDASEASLGRVSAACAILLLGKEKPYYSHHIDCGDYVIVVNADSLKVTGNKLTHKKYYRHSGHPGGLHSRSLKEQMEKDSTKVIIKAVRGMLPNNKLLDGRLARLKVYPGKDHNHSAQQPEAYSVNGESAK